MVDDSDLIFSIAGTDTTAITLSYFCWELGRRPDIVEKLRAELDTVPLSAGQEYLHRVGWREIVSLQLVFSSFVLTWLGHRDKYQSQSHVPPV